MLAKKDADMVVRGTAYNIARWARKSEQDVLAAIQVLSNPDTRRVEPQPHDGRRIIKHNEGWLIVNGKYYQDLMRTVHRKSYKAEKQREYRRGKPLAGEVAAIKAESNGNHKTYDSIVSARTQP